jgi:hypothetical protein
LYFNAGSAFFIESGVTAGETVSFRGAMKRKEDTFLDHCT